MRNFKEYTTFSKKKKSQDLVCNEKKKKMGKNIL